MIVNSYVAFLRGINVGGNKKVNMEELKKTFALLGCKNVKTFLNSGNVLFETSETDVQNLTQKIGDTLEKKLGFTIPVILRTGSEIKKLVDADPFNDVTVTPQTRRYITFLSEKPISKVKIPYESYEKSFRIILVSNSEICSVMTFSTNHNTTDAMKILEKEYGKNITTRNWNTIMRIGKALL